MGHKVAGAQKTCVPSLRPWGSQYLTWHSSNPWHTGHGTSCTWHQPSQGSCAPSTWRNGGR